MDKRIGVKNEEEERKIGGKRIRRKEMKEKGGTGDIEE